MNLKWLEKYKALLSQTYHPFLNTQGLVPPSYSNEIESTTVVQNQVSPLLTPSGIQRATTGDSSECATSL